MKLRVWFSGVLETRTALHIGTGTILSTATDAPILRGADGRPLIPGSSLKGALRATSERLLRALGQRACLVFGDESLGNSEALRCLTTDKAERDLFFKLKNGERRLGSEEREVAKNAFSPPAAWGEEPWKDFGDHDERQLAILNTKLCRACLTWGSPFLAGRVRVPDLRIATEAGKSTWPGTTEIRDGVGLDRDTGTAAPGVKFDLEVLPAGACFEFELIAEPDADLAVVALAVGELLRGGIPLGGRVTRGLGEIELRRFTIYEVDLANAEQLVRYLTRGHRTAYLEKEAVDRLEEILTKLMEERHAA